MLRDHLDYERPSGVGRADPARRRAALELEGEHADGERAHLGPRTRSRRRRGSMPSRPPPRGRSTRASRHSGHEYRRGRSPGRGSAPALRRRPAALTCRQCARRCATRRRANSSGGHPARSAVAQLAAREGSRIRRREEPPAEIASAARTLGRARALQALKFDAGGRGAHRGARRRRSRTTEEAA